MNLVHPLLLFHGWQDFIGHSVELGDEKNFSARLHLHTSTKMRQNHKRSRTSFTLNFKYKSWLEILSTNDLQ